MFTRLFAESGLSLDRLKALLEVGSAGSIVKAAEQDPVRQSQYSRQIKELEDFFRIKLIERQGKGTRLTPGGKELARISRFFLLGLSNFQRGCLAEEQTFRIGASATFNREFLLPVLSNLPFRKGGPAFAIETLADVDIERRLHDLTLDFGVVALTALSRPLQMSKIGEWHLQLWMPKTIRLGAPGAAKALKEKRLPLVVAKKESEGLGLAALTDIEPRLACDSFLEAGAAMGTGQMAAFLPDFLAPANRSKDFFSVHLPEVSSQVFAFRLAWNPRLLRLNPHASRTKDALVELLARRMGA